MPEARIPRRSRLLRELFLGGTAWLDQNQLLH
jgi:hypothetical protein